MRSAGQGNWRREHAAASLGKHGPAVADAAPYSNAKSDSVDLAESFSFADADSLFQRDSVVHLAAVDPSDVCVSNAEPERVV